MTHCVCVQFILLKLLGPRLETAERIGVVSVVLKGYRDVRVPVEDKQLSVVSTIQHSVSDFMHVGLVV